MTKKIVRKLSGVAILLSFFLMQNEIPYAQAQNQRGNYDNTVHTAIGGAGVMIGIGAAACTVLTAGGCGAVIASGVVLGGIGGTLATMGNPPNQFGPLPGDMPDASYDDCGMECQLGGGYGSMGDDGSDDGYEYMLPW